MNKNLKININVKKKGGGKSPLLKIGGVR